MTDNEAKNNPVLDDINTTNEKLEVGYVIGGTAGGKDWTVFR